MPLPLSCPIDYLAAAYVHVIPVEQGSQSKSNTAVVVLGCQLEGWGLKTLPVVSSCVHVKVYSVLRTNHYSCGATAIGLAFHKS